jgi:hypothetical protein
VGMGAEQLLLPGVGTEPGGRHEQRRVPFELFEERPFRGLLFAYFGLQTGQAADQRAGSQERHTILRPVWGQRRTIRAHYWAFRGPFLSLFLLTRLFWRHQEGCVRHVVDPPRKLSTHGLTGSAQIEAKPCVFPGKTRASGAIGTNDSPTLAPDALGSPRLSPWPRSATDAYHAILCAYIMRLPPSKMFRARQAERWVEAPQAGAQAAASRLRRAAVRGR